MNRSTRVPGKVQSVKAGWLPRILPTVASGPQLDLQPGTPVLVRYEDHVLFRDSDPATHFPWIRECIGWLDYQDKKHVRIVWERFAMPDPPNEARQRATGLVILKRNILEMRRV